MFDEFSGIDLANIPRARDNDSSAYTDEDVDEVDKIIHPDSSKPIFKVIKSLGEGSEKPGKFDSVTVEIQSTEVYEKVLSLPEESEALSSLIQTMKKSETSELHLSDTEQMLIKLKDWVSIKDLTEDGNLIKTIKKRGIGYDLIEYKDDVKLNLRVFTQTKEYINKEEIISCEVPAIPPGLFEILKSMKLLEESEVKVKPEYWKLNLAQLAEIDEDEIFVEIKILDLKKVEDMYLDGSFYKKHVVEGEGKNLPNPNAIVRIWYKLEITGRVVLNNFEGETLEIRMDEDEVPSLWTHCLRQMKEGDVVKVECNMMGLHSSYINDGLDKKFNFETYAGSDEHSCIFLISLISFDMGKVNYNMTYEDRVVEANRIKDAGNKLFKVGRFDKALEKYESANSSLEPITDCPYLLRPVSLLLFGNITLCYLKLEKWHEAESNARKVMEHSPNDVKALYRRALARIALQNLEAAAIDLKNAKGICEEKGDKEMLAIVVKEIQKIGALSKESRAQEKKLYGKMFS